MDEIEAPCEKDEQELGKIINKRTDESKNLLFRVMIGYGLGHAFNDICGSLINTYLLLFMTLILKFGSAEAGIVILSGQIADAVANPIVGVLSDKMSNFRLCKYGKRKMWHFMGSILVGVCFPLIFLNLNWSLISYIVCYIMFQFGWAAVQNSHLSLMPELSVTKRGRTKLAAVRYCFTVIANILVYLITWIILNQIKDQELGLENKSSSFRNIMLICSAVGIMASLSFYLLVKENSSVSKIDDNNMDNVNGDTKKRGELLQIFKDFTYYQGAMVYMTTLLFTNIIQILIPLYVNQTFKMSGTDLVLIPLSVYIGSLFVSLFVNRLIKILKRLATFCIGSIIGFACCIWLYTRSQSHGFESGEIYGLAVSFGIASCILQVTTLGAVADLISGKNHNSSVVYGFMTLCDKLSTGIAVFIIECYSEKVTSEMFYGNSIAIVCGCAIVLGLPFMIALLKCIRAMKVPVPTIAAANLKESQTTV